MDDQPQDELLRQRSFEFHLAEYNRLTGEVTARISDGGKFEVWSIAAVAVLIAWIFSYTQELTESSLMPFARVLPAFVVVGSIVRHAYHYLKIRETAAYIKSIERMYRDTKIVGWEHVRSGEQPGYPAVISKNWHFIVSQILIWLPLAFMSIYVALPTIQIVYRSIFGH